MSEAQENKLKVIQSKALEENSKTFLNKASNDLIQPMKNELTSSLKQLESNLKRLNEMEKQFVSTSADVKQFTFINTQMRRETEKLTNALQGNSKTTGTWGEMTWGIQVSH